MKTNAFISIGFGVMIGLASCSNKNNNESESMLTDSSMMDTSSSDTTWYDEAHASISGTKADTTVSGMAHFTRKGDNVELSLELNIPKKANSTVAVHFHEHGACGDMGNDAHGHWNPTNEDHGQWGSAQYHSGDIGNIKLDKDGKVTFKVETNRWTIGGPSSSNILNKALIVHSGVDDYKTQPTGNSGTRIGCGVISNN